MTKATTQRTLRFQQVVHTVNSIFSRAKENKTKKGQLNKKKRYTTLHNKENKKQTCGITAIYIFLVSFMICGR